MQQYSGLLQFRMDPLLSLTLRKNLDHVLADFTGAERSESLESVKLDNKFVVDFVSESSLHTLKAGSEFRICLLDNNQGLFSFSQNLDESLADAVLDDALDFKQLERLILPGLLKVIREKENLFISLGLKNIRKFELKAKKIITKNNEDLFTSDFLLGYTQVLVDLEKELIQADELSKLDKILKHFAKINIERSKFQFHSSKDLGHLKPSENFLLLPPFKGEFIAIEMNWDEEEPLKLVKRLLFFYTIVNYFKGQHEIADPFHDETLWESVLDAIPFPVALLSGQGEVHQHNSLFSKLAFPPSKCLRLKIREKILINDIPYNIFRKDIHHMDQEKILFVFFF
jgi:hypothetical protein